MFLFPTIILRVERWKFNKDYGIYVSTLGNFKDRHKRRLPIKVNQNGYCLVKTECSKPWKFAHRLVMLTWKPIPDAERLTVDHLNHNKRENTIYNLEWVTQKENIRRATKDHVCTNDTEDIIGIYIQNSFYSTPEDAKQALYKLKPDSNKANLDKAVEDLFTGVNFQGVKNIGKKSGKITMRICKRGK